MIDEYRLVVHPVVLGAGEQLFNAPLTIAPMSTTTFSRGAVAHVFAAHPRSSWRLLVGWGKLNSRPLPPEGDGRLRTGVVRALYSEFVPDHSL